MKKTAWFRSLSAVVLASAAILASAFCASAPASAQSGVPPTFVQVPFVSAVAGGASAMCSGAITIGGNNYGDGCPATQITLPTGSATVYSTATDKWGNVYYGATTGSTAVGIVQVIYAGATTVNGVANPATAMIEAANAAAGTPQAGYVYTVAGGQTAAPSACSNGATKLSGGSGSGCPGTDAYIKKAYGVAVDNDGNVFILDESNTDVYVLIANASTLGAQLATLEYANYTTATAITPAVGSIYLIAGTSGYADGGYAINGKLHNPYGIAVDASDNLYITDYTNNAVRMINGPNTTTAFGSSTTPGILHTIGGDCTSSACTALSAAPASNTAALGAAFLSPGGIAVDASGNVYVGDNSAGTTTVPATVRVIYAGGANNPLANLINLETGISAPTQGYVYTLGGAGANGDSSALGNGELAYNGSFDRPYGLAVDKNGNIWVADYSSKGLIAEINASNGYLYFLQGTQLATLGAGNYCNGGSTGPTMTDKYGDGCPATQSGADHIYGNPSFDAQGNLYFADNGDGLIRKLTFSSFPATSVGSTAATQTLAFTLLTGSSSETASNVAVATTVQGSNNGEFGDVAAGDTCTGSTILTGFPSTSASVSTSSTAAYTCTVPVNFAPAKAGLREGAVTISATVNSATVSSTAFISGAGDAAGLAIDPSAASAIGTAPTGANPASVAVDAAGNSYIVWSNGELLSTPAGAATSGISGVSGSSHQAAIDGAGDVYVADTGNNRIAELAAGSTAFTAAVSSVFGTALNAPQGVALDGAGNLYIADTGNQRVLFVPLSGQPQMLGSGFETPVSVAVDAGGNIYVADSGLGEIVKIAADGTQSAIASSIAPVSLAVDAAGNVVYLDSALKEAIEIPVSGTNTVVASGFTTPNNVAIDGNGGVYVSDSSATSISYYPRNAASYAFTSGSDSVTATVSSIGNAAYSGTVAQAGNASDFTLNLASSNGCASTTALSLTVGQNCAYTALFTPTDSGSLTDTVTFTNANSFNGNPTLTLTGTNASAKVNTDTTISVNTSSPVYGSGVELTITVRAESGSTTPFSALNGQVSYTVDGGTAVGPVLPNGTSSGASSSYTFTLSGLSAGSHTISATYTPGATSGFNTSTTTTSFTIAPLTITATAPAVTAVYGTTVASEAGTLTGVVSGDTVTASCGAPSGTLTVAGSPYTLACTLGGSAAGNYTLGTVTGTLTITPATITVAIANASKVYGSANPTLTGTLTGVVGTDSVSATYSTTATQYSPVTAAGYPITASGLTGSAAGNYTLGAVTNGTLTVTPLAITATATPVSVAYGSAIPAITGTLTGVVNNDSVTPSFTTTATSGSAVGTYPITLSGLTGAAAANYTATLTGSPVVTITSDTVSVVVNNATRAYGAANPAFTGTLTGVLPADAANVAAVYSTTATANSSAGNTYPITATGLTGSAAGNYSLGAVTPGTLTITQAATTTTLAVSAASVGSGQQVTFTATVASSTTGTPSGSVQFISAGSTLGTITLSGGVASFSTSNLPVGTSSVTATYVGSTNFAASTSSAVSTTVTVPVVSGTPSASSLSVSAGSTATTTISLAAEGGYVGTATYSCGALPAEMACSFSPASSTFTATSTTASTTLTISTNGQAASPNDVAAGQVAARQSKGGMGKTPLMALAGLFAGLCMLSRARKGLRRYIALVILLVAGLAGIGGMAGCGGSSSSSKTPAGTYNIQVIITAGTVQEIPLTVTVK